MSTVLGNTIANDHRTVYALRDQYVALAGQPQEQTLLATQLMWEIARHVTTEEILIHPLCEKYLGNEMGAKLAEFDGNEHSMVKNNLIMLLDLKMSPGQAEFDHMLEKTLADLHRHNDSEEASDVPTLEKHMSLEEAEQVAQAFEAAKQFFLPERFDKGAGDNITENALRNALTTPSDTLGAQMIKFLGISPVLN